LRKEEEKEELFASKSLVVKEEKKKDLLTVIKSDREGLALDCVGGKFGEEQGFPVLDSSRARLKRAVGASRR
jgi:hypothetical protein